MLINDEVLCYNLDKGECLEKRNRTHERGNNALPGEKKLTHNVANFRV